MNTPSDSDIRTQVESELSRRSPVDATYISVHVSDGIVTLTGYTHNFSFKYDLENIVKRMAGMAALANDVQVLPSTAVSDAELARAAVAMLKRHLPHHWEHIRPIVCQGFIRLEGMVSENSQREKAEEAVRAARSAECVVNLIRLAPVFPPVRAEFVKRRMEESFRQNGGHDSSQINVQTDSAGVVLRGYTSSWDDRRLAEEGAWSARGVTSVRNELSVRFEGFNDPEHSRGPLRASGAPAPIT